MIKLKAKGDPKTGLVIVRKDKIIRIIKPDQFSDAKKKIKEKPGD